MSAKTPEQEAAAPAAEINLHDGDLIIGLSELSLRGAVVNFTRGIVLEDTFAHLMSPMTMAFHPPGPNGYHPAPWKSVRGGHGQDITAQITIPGGAAPTFEERFEIASTLVFLLRLWTDPGITMPAMANIPFRDMALENDGYAYILPVEHLPRHFELKLADGLFNLDSLEWVHKHFETTLMLRKQSAAFRLACSALDRGQFINNTALSLISLWGALEALFSPSSSELRFRVSSLIAAYLIEPGPARRDKQKEIAGLYDKRSAAAHGKPSHGEADLLATFELLRDVLIQSICQEKAPTKQDLEDRLFGAL